jgi:bifunctional DNase/RNase
MRMIEIYKVIFCSQSKKYKIIFRTLENDKEFILYFEAQYAKNIAMASENIISISLSQYELFINLLNELKLKIDRVSLIDKNNILNCTLNLSNNNDNNNIEIYSFVGYAIILSLKTFSSIYIDEKFLLDINYDNNISDKFYFKNDNTESLEKITENRGESIDSKVVILESALDECINKENYEAAAFIRDRIKQIKKQ